MPIAITDDHRALAETVRDFLAQNSSLGAARALLDGGPEGDPPFWAAATGLGWLGLHVPEEFGGSGYSMEEAVIVAEELGAALAPGAFVPTMVASAAVAASGTDDQKRVWLPGLAAGSLRAAISVGATVTVTGATASGSAGTALCAAIADVLLVESGDDLAVVDLHGVGVAVTVPRNLDPTRTSAHVTLTDAPVQVAVGGAAALRDASRTLLAAEATGIARFCTTQAAEYAKVRIQFGRPIATYQAVKHHCANMAVATELATAAVWDAARAAATGGDQYAFTAAMAATLAAEAADLCANLDIQVHGGIGFTWEHDAHLYLRRATTLGAFLHAERAAREVTDLTRAGVRRERTVALPPEAEAYRAEIRAFAERVRSLDPAARRDLMVDEGYAMPHWPAPYGRNAGAIEQLVIEQEFQAAGIARPDYGITGWVILTLIQHATEDQVARWVDDALRERLIWCQLFSEPDAGSDAAGIKTRGVRVDGGWLVNGQKVWTSGAHEARWGFATIRTDPDVPKHQGITTMVIDMEGPGVEVRPLKMPSGGKEFNEVFFNDVFVSDDDVVGPIDGGWTVARATLGNESVSIGAGSGGRSMPGEMMIPPHDAHPERLSGGAGRIGRYIATHQAMGMMNLRSANRAVIGGGPGPEGNVAKLVISEISHEAAAIMAELSGPESAFLEGDGQISGSMVLMHRALSIAGGTSEIKRNQIGEQILGLPRDPLISK